MNDKKNLVIYGNGSIAIMLYYYLKDHYNIVGFCVDQCCIVDSKLESLPVVSFEKVDVLFPPIDHVMIIAVGFVQMNKIREKKYEEAKKRGYDLISYIHPTVSYSPNVEFGQNVIILEFTSIHSGSKIGHNTFISSNSNIGHDCKIANHCWINAGVSIAGGTSINDKSFFGMNSCVGNGISIAEKTFIGASTYINKNTQPGDVYLPNESVKFKMKSEKFLKIMNIT